MLKKKNYENLTEEGNNQPSTILKIFSELGAGKQKSNSASNIRSVKLGDQEIEKPADIANSFNDFFINIAESVKEPSDQQIVKNCWIIVMKRFLTMLHLTCLC